MKTYRDTTRTWTVINCAKDGARMTREASAISESSCRTKKDKLFLAVARKLSIGRGYLIATPNELMKRFPDSFSESEKHVHATCPDNDRKFIWGIEAFRTFGSRKFHFGFCPIG